MSDSQLGDYKEDINSKIFLSAVKKLSLRFPVAMISEATNYKKSNVSAFLKGKKPVPDTFLDNFLITYRLRKEDFLNKQLSDDNSIVEVISDEKKERKIIPLYDEAGSIGGQNMVANMDAVSQPSDYIDTGDWFRDATAAIRHYEDSMLEYPSGCILAVKEVKDKRLIVPGRDYVIETSEYRVTKKVQTVPGGVFFVAHSTNLDTYPNGTLIHPPFEVPWDAVTSISLVLGYVVNKNGGKVFYSNSKN